MIRTRLSEAISLIWAGPDDFYFESDPPNGVYFGLRKYLPKPSFPLGVA